MSIPNRLAAGALLMLAAAACDRPPTAPATAPAPLEPAGRPSFVLSGDTLMWTDFSEYASGAQPAGWTQAWDPTSFFGVADEAGATGGKVLQWSATGQSRNRWALAYDGLGDRGDQVVYTEFRVRSLGGGASTYYMGAAAVRVGGTAEDERGYAVFFVTVPSSGATSVVLSTWTSGAYVQLGSWTTDWQMDQWYSVRLEAAGTTIRARVWPRGEAEPSTWQLSATDNRYPTGRPGVSHHDNGTVQWDVWRVSAAPPPPPPPPPPPISVQEQFTVPAAWAAPAGWTETSAPENSAWTVAADLSVQDGRALRNVSTVTGRHILRMSEAHDTVRDQEILVKLRMADSDSRGPGVALRHTMSGANASAYVAYFRPELDQVEINRFVNGAWGFVATGSFPNNPGAWYWLRFRAQGTQLLARAWADGQPEPAGWTVTGTDPTVLLGAAGAYTYEPNTVDYDLVSYASGGNAAVAPPPGTGPVLDSVVTPPFASGVTTQAVQLRAWGRLTTGDSVGITPAWSTVAPGNVTVDGVFTASVANTYPAVAAFGGRADTTMVQISNPPASLEPSGYVTQFGESAPGTLYGAWSPTSAPTGVSWAAAATTTPSGDGLAMRATVTSTGRHILQMEEMEIASNMEVLTLLRMNDSDDRGPGLALRHSMTGANATAYVAYLRPGSDLLEINRFVNGSWGFVAATAYVNDPGTWYWMRFRAQGTTLQLRVWPAGTPEPTTWQITATDGAITWGMLGLYTYEANTVDYDVFTATTGTGSAPTP